MFHRVIMLSHRAAYFIVIGFGYSVLCADIDFINYRIFDLLLH